MVRTRCISKHVRLERCEFSEIQKHKQKIFFPPPSVCHRESECVKKCACHLCVFFAPRRHERYWFIFQKCSQIQKQREAKEWKGADAAVFHTGANHQKDYLSCSGARVAPRRVDGTRNCVCTENANGGGRYFIFGWSGRWLLLFKLALDARWCLFYQAAAALDSHRSHHLLFQVRSCWI